jgi:transcription elongation GreA/GreB family factor
LQAEDRAAQAAIARDLRYWSTRRASAQVVKSPDTPAKVAFGTTVTIERDDGRKQTWRIVGEDEADPAHGTLSYVSPVARALMGKRIGDVVRAGNSDAEIVGIS